MTPEQKRHILGLTGSLGSGKSFVASLLAECGAVVHCADSVSRQVVEPGTPALAEIVRIFGTGILAADGSLDRKAMGAIVFADSNQRKTLEGIIHPHVRMRMRELLQQANRHPLVVLDVPLLFESGVYSQLCTATVSVTVPEATRVQRLQLNRGMAIAEINARLSAQLPQAEKDKRADYRIDNSGTPYATCQQVSALLDHLFPGSLPDPLKHPNCDSTLSV